MLISSFLLKFQLEDSMESVEGTAKTAIGGYDVNDNTLGDSFIRKAKWSDDEWSINSSENSKTHIDDTMDVCNYRIVEKFKVNQADVVTNSTQYELIDNSEVDWNSCFFDDSSNGKLIALEDTLEICNYRRAPIEAKTLAESKVATGDAVVIKYQPNLKQFLNNISAVDTNDYIWNQSIELFDESSNESATRLEDTMDVFSYRHKAYKGAIKQQMAQPKTPARGNMENAKYFNKVVIPKHLFGTPLIRNGRPVTSSPIEHSFACRRFK